MEKRRFYYLIRLQYLGFRFSGWQKQPGQKTIEQMLLKTLKFVLPNQKIKILGAGRTDAKVSALDGAFELFTEYRVHQLAPFIDVLNKNLPPDIRVTQIRETDKTFNIIQNSKYKEYVYLFAFGVKSHPFSAPFVTTILDQLDLELMQEATKLFEGEHNFSAYTARIQKNTQSVRTIDSCLIRRNELLKANFFPDESYALHVTGKGFMRYQVRMIMGALIQLGKGALTLTDIENSLKADSTIQLTYVAPGSGLLLNSLEFE